MKVEELDIRSDRDIGCWRALWRRCPDASPFQHPDWVLPWRAHVAPAIEPCVLGLRTGAALVGVAPLGLVHDSGRPTLVLLGGEQSDYHGVLAHPQARGDVSRALFAWLEERRREFGRCILGQLEEDCPLLDFAPPTGLLIERRPQDVCPYVPTGAVPRGFEKRVSQTLRRAGRAGVCETVRISPTDVSSRLDVLFALHGARWGRRDLAGAFADPRVRGFHRAAAPRLARQGLLWLVEARLDGIPIASLLALVGHGRVLLYNSGFDPGHATLSPGRLAIAELVRLAAAAGAREVDFLRGVERYKYDWGARNRTTWQLRVDAGAS